MAKKTPDSLYKEVSAFIGKKIERNEVVRVKWAVHAFIRQKQAVENEDADFYRVCAYHHVERLVKRCIGRFNPTSAPEPEVTLFGFEHLQIAYTVQRQGEQLLVPVHLMTNEELTGRADEYDAMAVGCKEHARELRRYLSERRRGAALGSGT